MSNAPGSDIARAVQATQFVDTHEHLVEEERRTAWQPGNGLLPCNDWALLLSHYLDSDLHVAGMTPDEYSRLTSPDVAPDAKWPILAPYWPAVKHTGYGQAVRLAVQRLYGVRDIGAGTVARLDSEYRAMLKPGYYRKVLREHAGVESCQVNSLEAPFSETKQPDLLMQDLSILQFSPYTVGDLGKFGDAVSVRVDGLAAYHRVIDAWFARYGRYAVAVKSQAAYFRGLDFEVVPPERAEPILRRLLDGDPVPDSERKALDDHVFWHAVGRATEMHLPVKLHTGYYAGHNQMPLGRLAANPWQACELARRSPETRFVFMHIGYPYQDEMMALAKHWTNATIDMCWAWIINPAASERFVREFLMAAPTSKLLTFGGDYIEAELVVGHAAIARRGLTNALSRLVDDGWLSRTEAVDLVEPLMRGNARRLFRVEQKAREMRSAPWLE